MNTPNLPAGRQWFDKDGNMLPEVHNVFIQTWHELQTKLSQEGFVVPQQTTANINLLVDPNKSTGAFIYDSDTDQMKVNINGVWKVVQTA